MPDVVLAALILAPPVVTFFLKSNAALGFWALCVGFVLSTSAIGGLRELLNQMDLSVADTTLAFILIGAPFLLTLLLTRKSAGKGPMFILQMVAAFGAGGLLALSIGPLLAISGSLDLLDSSLWNNLQKFQAHIIGLGALVSLFLVWSSNLKGLKSKKH